MPGLLPSETSFPTNLEELGPCHTELLLHNGHEPKMFFSSEFEKSERGLTLSHLRSKVREDFAPAASESTALPEASGSALRSAVRSKEDGCRGTAAPRESRLSSHFQTGSAVTFTVEEEIDGRHAGQLGSEPVVGFDADPAEDLACIEL